MVCHKFIIEQKNVSDSISIALKNVHGHSATASQLRASPYRLVNRKIPGTPPYWKKFMREVIAMVKQLGIPTWFMTLSRAHLRRVELFKVLAKRQ